MLTANQHFFILFLFYTKLIIYRNTRLQLWFVDKYMLIYSIVWKPYNSNSIHQKKWTGMEKLEILLHCIYLVGVQLVVIYFQQYHLTKKCLLKNATNEHSITIDKSMLGLKAGYPRVSYVFPICRAVSLREHWFPFMI